MSSSPFTVLNSSHARSSNAFPRASELERELRSHLLGEVRFDAGSRALYATDASNYRQVPIGLVVPRNIEDVIAATEICRRLDAPILSRGAGTSLAGQGCNEAVVFDFSKYLNHIGEINSEARTVDIQPGAILDRIRDAAEQYNLTFAPDPATHSRCTIGGMIGNNSCGVHGLLGGKTVDNIESLDILLYDGTRMTVSNTSELDLQQKIRVGGRTGQIYGGLKEIRDQYAQLIHSRFPRIPRRVSGYNLDELLPENCFNVARSLVGSEGTCVIVLGAKLRLVSSPTFRTLVVLGFPDVFIAADIVPAVLQHNPIGLEGFDGTLVESLKRKQKLLKDIELLPDGNGFLLVEFGADSEEESRERAKALALSFEGSASSRVYPADEARRIWNVRESALGATAFVPGVGTGWEGWEDAAVDPARLGSYLRQISSLMHEFDYHSSMYGHFGQGCVHMRHNFDLSSAAGVLRFREFVERAADIAVAHGGSLSGEHGDGQARGVLLPKMFGPEIMDAFRAFKKIWDPSNRLNPGKLIDANEIHQDLRLGADYNPWIPSTHFSFSEEQGSLATAALRCVGVGLCRKENAGSMCPSFMATKEEMHSTRGRAHMLWELMQGEILPNGWHNQDVKDSLDLCLSCKACKSECPVSVDIATYKSEFLSHYYDGNRRPSHYAFGRIDRMARLASYAPSLANALNNAPLLGSVAKRALGIHPKRTFPRFAKAFTRTSGKNSQRANGKVLLWPDTFNNYFRPSTLENARRVLVGAGVHAYWPTAHLCCGRPLYDFGMLDKAKQYLTKVLNYLNPEIASGTPIVVLEPSCASVFRDELVNLLPDDPRSHKLAKQVFLLSEFLVKYVPDYTPPRVDRKLLVHLHCHHRAVFGIEDELRLLRSTGAPLEVLDSGCCGMAGPFGFEKEKFEVSQKLAERVLLPSIRNAPDALLVTNGFSCSEQVCQNGMPQPAHLADILALGLPES